MAAGTMTVHVKDLPLFKDMAEFILVCATTDDALPLLIRARAIQIAQEIKAAVEDRKEEASDDR